MIKNFKFYALIWGILLVAWCCIVFLVRPIIPGFVINYDKRFWISFVFIVATFVGNLICTYFAFKAENSSKMFLNLSLITVSWSALVTMLVVGVVLMLIPNCRAWTTAIICIVIFAFNAIAVVKAVWALDVVNNIDEKVKVKTSFVKNTVAKAENLVVRAKNDEIRSECKKVYEAIRYSDPMSDETFSVVEAKITVKMDELLSAVNADDISKAKEIANEIIILVSERNTACKCLK